MKAKDLKIGNVIDVAGVHVRVDYVQAVNGGRSRITGTRVSDQKDFPIVCGEDADFKVV